ncbi:MAG TPA: UDP-N-acetylglucosamine 1-carboxyvinyltransferase, partial [Clostridia bacterium]|nr:UDP-N-acetylglucosamine 1-carboxyvinyltransferase [Clostridia bacterium]
MKYSILGGNCLEGSVDTSGAKNAVLPLMAASMLTREPVILNNIPNITDISTMQNILRNFGSETVRLDNRLIISNERITRTSADYEQASRIRASVLVMGPLLARLGMVSMPLPGGCAIGSRPLDLHIKGFCALGASIEFSSGYIRAKAHKLRGADIYLDFPSVGATENIMMAGVLADGVTIIRNAAAEPEITDTA